MATDGSDIKPRAQQFRRLRRVGKCAGAVLEVAGSIVVGVAPLAAMGAVGFAYFYTGSAAYQAVTTKTTVTDAWITSGQPLRVNEPATLEIVIHQSGGDTSDAQLRIQLPGGMNWLDSSYVVGGGCQPDPDGQQLDCGAMKQGQTRTVSVTFEPRKIGNTEWSVSASNSKTFSELVQ